MILRPSAAGLLALTVASSACGGETILYQSATPGPTGITTEQLLSQDVPGTNVSPGNFVGARFELLEPVVTSRIGGHFASLGVAGNLFGIVVALDGENDLPDSNDLSTPDVLGSTLIDLSEPSANVYGDLGITLTPGWYAVAFGSGLFGALGGGGAVNNGTSVQNVDYIGRGGLGEWASVPVLARDGQLLEVFGVVVPEPLTALTACSAVAVCAARQGRRNNSP